MYSYIMCFASYCVKMYCLGCVNFNTNTDAHEDPNIAENVASWSACSDLCRARTDVDCQFWTWVDENGPAGWALRCITMSNIPTTRPANNIVSGGRECEGIAGRPTIIQEFIQKQSTHKLAVSHNYNYNYYNRNRNSNYNYYNSYYKYNYNHNNHSSDRWVPFQCLQLITVFTRIPRHAHCGRKFRP